MNPNIKYPGDLRIPHEPYPVFYNNHELCVKTWYKIAQENDFDPCDVEGVTENTESCIVKKCHSHNRKAMFLIRIGKDEYTVPPSFLVAANIPIRQIRIRNPRFNPAIGDTFLNHVYTREIRLMMNAPSSGHQLIEYVGRMPSFGKVVTKPPIERSSWNRWAFNAVCFKMGQ